MVHAVLEELEVGTPCESRGRVVGDGAEGAVGGGRGDSVLEEVFDAGEGAGWGEGRAVGGLETLEVVVAQAHVPEEATEKVGGGGAVRLGRVRAYEACRNVSVTSNGRLANSL